MDHIAYNKTSSLLYSWQPSWFGRITIDKELIYEIAKWQRTHQLTVDGLMGPLTYKKLWLERERNIHRYQPLTPGYSNKNSYIVHNSNFAPIEWPKVILWSEPSGLKTRRNAYYDYSGKRDRTPTQFINHWDVCLSSAICAKVLHRRKISIHFCIDNDGTIYQLLDTQHGAWHAGNRTVNKNAIGVEISNAYYLKHQSQYIAKGFSSRPIAKNITVHNKTLSPFLDFYSIQIEALKALWKAIHINNRIPLEYPKVGEEFCTTIHPPTKTGIFSGFANHYNISLDKIDCANLDLPLLLTQVKQLRTNYCPT